MPQLAAFPKAYMDALCVTGTMTLREWIEIGAELKLDGLEFYIRFLELQKPGGAQAARQVATDHGLAIPGLQTRDAVGLGAVELLGETSLEAIWQFTAAKSPAALHFVQTYQTISRRGVGPEPTARLPVAATVC